MKLLLFDQNISPRVIDRLADFYPGSIHVSMLGMGSAMDIEIWQYARENDYMTVTKDADFSEFGVVKGFPPKIIGIRRGNCSTQNIETILRENYPNTNTIKVLVFFYFPTTSSRRLFGRNAFNSPDLTIAAQAHHLRPGVPAGDEMGNRLDGNYPRGRVLTYKRKISPQHILISKGLQVRCGSNSSSMMR